MTRNCSPTPIATAQGLFATRRKSERESVVPIPNMMIWIAGTTIAVSFTPPQEMNSFGNANATAAHARIAIPNPCPLRNDNNLFSAAFM